MADLYLERIGLARPTIVKRDNDGEIERLESVGLDIASLVAFWRRCFDLNGLLFEKITLHCKSKDFNAMGQRTLATCRSVRELLAEQGVECVIDDEWFKDREFKNEQLDSRLFEQNMKNVLEIEKKNAVKEFVKKFKEKARKGAFRNPITYKFIERDYTITESELDELLQEYKNEQEK